MTEKHFNTNLIVLGDLITGVDGCADVKGFMTTGHSDGQSKMEYLEELLKKFKDGSTILTGDYDIAGQHISIDGNLCVYGDVRFDPENYQGYIATA